MTTAKGDSGQRSKKEGLRRQAATVVLERSCRALSGIPVEQDGLSDLSRDPRRASEATLEDLVGLHLVRELIWVRP